VWVAVLGLCLCLYALIGGLVALDYERVKLELYDCRRVARSSGS
jgi:hypothetical protein